MSDMVDIIPDGERGSFKVTERELMQAGAVTMEAFEVLVCQEAEARGLNLTIWRNDDWSVTFEWEPKA